MSGDTIFALSSASGKAGVSVVRVSGDKAWQTLDVLTQGDNAKPQARYAKMLKLSNPVSRETMDHALVIGFEAPNSFTGEDVVEYHCHGSPAVLEELFSVLGTIEGCRMAEHGEFTRRAFENNKMDLTEAEAIADLIDAETMAQKHQALAQMGGSLSRLYNQWAEDLTKALAYIEAIIDFPDEEVPDEETAKARPAIEALLDNIKDHLNDGRRGERLRDGLQIVIVGAPNAGKSSLVNALAQRDVAIVSDIAGTTRDIIETHLNLGGYPVILSDTAGLRPDQITNEGHDKIESEGIKRALDRAKNADLRIVLFDGSAEEPDKHSLDLIDEQALVVINKADISANIHNVFHVKHLENALEISTKTGAGLDVLVKTLTEVISKRMLVSRETPSLTRQRHRDALDNCVASLKVALSQTLPELMAEELRHALSKLGRITGRVDVEDLLDVIFKDFCIGK